MPANRALFITVVLTAGGGLGVATLACDDAPAPASTAKPGPRPSAAGPSTGAATATSAAKSGAPHPSGSAPRVPSDVAPAPAPRVRPPKKLVRRPPHSGVKKAAAWAGPIEPTNDAAWLKTMASDRVVAFQQNKGGSTVTIRVRFASGSRAVFKADQTRSATNYRAEIAAYHVDRLVGLGRTAPVVGRTFGRKLLRQHLKHSGAPPVWLKRFDDEVKDDGAGVVAGALIAWHDKRLYSEAPPRAEFAKLRSGDARSERHLAWSDMLVFDFLIDNTDRWSGGNVLTLGKDGPLIFLDNGSGFTDWRAQRHFNTERDLAKTCTFRPATLARLRYLGPEARTGKRLGDRLRRSLARDPLAPVLRAYHYAAIDERLDLVLKHAKRCQTKEAGGAALAPSASANSSSPKD